MTILFYIGGVILAYCIFLIVYKLKRGVCKELKRLDGKTVLITGGNRGIGYYTARDLAFKGARVVLGCRNESRGKAAVESIQRQTGNKNVTFMPLDLASFASVRKFAEDFDKKEDRLDILINNAGICLFQRYVTSDNLEMTYQVNFFSHFLLTLLLLDKLKASSPGRVIMLSSVAHTLCRIRDLSVDNFRGKGSYFDCEHYFHTKVFGILFARELARKLEGTGVTVNSLHPGSVNTEFYDTFGFGLKPILQFLGLFFFRSAESGAQTSLYLALSADVGSTSGKYFADCRLAKPSAMASDGGLARKLWEVSEEITGQKF